jgi:hypothetical protein
LIDEKKFAEADRFYGAEKQFFCQDRQAQAPLIRRLADGLNSTYDPRLAIAVERLQFATNGPTQDVGGAVADAEGLISEYIGHHTFSTEEFLSPKLERLGRQSRQLWMF